MRTHAATFRVPAREAAFTAALEGLTRVNEVLMQREKVPPLYEAGVRYQDEPRDVWRHALNVVGEGWGDCEDLSAYRAAELRHTGEDPGAAVTVYRSGPGRFHAVVKRGDGTLEDPSRALGMGAPKMKLRPNRSANLVGADPTPADAFTFDIIKVPAGYGKRGGYRGYFRLPLGMIPGLASPQAMFTVGPQAATADAALAAAAASAQKALLDNPAIKDVLSKVPAVAQAAQVLTNPSVVAALKNPASLANLTTALARPDIAVQNVQKLASGIKSIFG